MIDLHTHTLFSDGELLPSELIRRAESMGLRALAITDHVDISNIDFVLERILAVCRELEGRVKIKVLPGVEITHVLPADFAKLVAYVRKKCKAIIVAHGETFVEPVNPGTNLAAIKAKVDILAHPGLISEQEVKLAALNGVCLEISGRKGHCLGNGHVAKLARAFKAKLVLNTDTHSPENLITRDQANRIARGAGLEEEEIQRLIKNSEQLVADFFHDRNLEKKGGRK